MKDNICFKCHKNRETAKLETWWKFSGHSFNKVLVNQVDDITLCSNCTQLVLDSMGIKSPTSEI